MPKKKDDSATEAISIRAFIKLLRADRTHEDLDRLKVYNTERQPITSAIEINGMIIISSEEA